MAVPFSFHIAPHSLEEKATRFAQVQLNYAQWLVVSLLLRTRPVQGRLVFLKSVRSITGMHTAISYIR